MNNTKHRSPFAIAARLIVLVRPMLPIMLAAIVMGVIGHFCATFITIFGGFALGAAAGTAIAVLTAALPWADWLLGPAVKVIRAIPVASFIVLVLLWAPTTSSVPAIVSALMVPPCRRKSRSSVPSARSGTPCI